jgi:hypothetical protein
VSKYIYRVTSTHINPRTGSAVFNNFECDYPTIDLLVSALNDGRIIIGSTLRSRSTGEPGVYEVLARHPMALAKSGVAGVEIPRGRFVECGEGERS